MQIHPSNCNKFPQFFLCIFLFSCVLYLENGHFSPEVPDGQKGTRKLCFSSFWDENHLLQKKKKTGTDICHFSCFITNVYYSEVFYSSI